MLLGSLPVRIVSYLRWRGRQIASLPRKTGNALFGTAYNDNVLARRIKRTPGSVPVGPRVGIYTIYPVAGLQRSHFDTLVAMRAAGIATFVISNLPLSAVARADLAANATMVIERPNFGYDFGAYREGILTLQKQQEKLTSLVFLNDSVWFPLGPGDWLAAAAQSKHNMFGAVSNYGIRFASDTDSGEASWEYDPGRRNFHYCSFALRFDSMILADPGFWVFWRRFRLTNDKFTTIHRGEIGLSRWVLSRGYSHYEVFPTRRLAKILGELDFPNLLTVAQELVIPEDAGLRARKRALIDSLQDTALSSRHDAARRLRSFVLKAVVEAGPAYAIPGFAIEKLDFPFLKKSPVWLDEETRRITLDILKRLGPQDYVSEVQALLKTRGL